MAEPQFDPSGYGRRPLDGPQTSRQELDRRQAGKLNSSKNGELHDAKTAPYLTPDKSAT